MLYMIELPSFVFHSEVKKVVITTMGSCYSREHQKAEEFAVWEVLTVSASWDLRTCRIVYQKGPRSVSLKQIKMIPYLYIIHILSENHYFCEYICIVEYLLRQEAALCVTFELITWRSFKRCQQNRAADITGGRWWDIRNTLAQQWNVANSSLV